MAKGKGDESAFSVAIFPYLKTSGPISIGTSCFRSTDDLQDLPPDQTKAVQEITRMLFVKDHLRVVSGSYAIVPHVDPNRPGNDLDRLIELQAVVAYLYSQPHEVFDSLLLTPEDCTLHLLTQAKVSKFLVRPEHHTVSACPDIVLEPSDEHHFLQGYQGLFNLRRPFWVEAGSRIYPSVPHVTLNISQDMVSNLDVQRHEHGDILSPMQLLTDPESSTAKRILTALHWYNFANEQTAGPDRALLNLAIAFEALLLLPEEAKSERLVDTISLLIGRIARVDVWARQFYRARSRVAHEGRAQNLHFYSSDLGGKPGKLDGRAAPLMFYGRQIFQLCVATLISGGELAKRADMGEKLITNGERLTAICKILAETDGDLKERFRKVGTQVAALQRYNFLDSGAIKFSTILGAIRAVCTNLLQLNPDITSDAQKAVGDCAAPIAGRDEFDQLDALRILHETLKAIDTQSVSFETKLMVQLVEYAWMATFMPYYRLRDQRKSEKSSTDGGGAGGE
tara:strand:+ start:2017 stop:3546 length:1530 start_codon:yes stop_codon:yes gene_type:complete